MSNLRNDVWNCKVKTDKTIQQAISVYDFKLNSKSEKL